MSIHEIVQDSWNQLHPGDKKALVKAVGIDNFPQTDSVSDMEDPTAGRLILAHRQGYQQGFSIPEYHRVKDALGNKNPSLPIRMVRGIFYTIGKHKNPSLY